VRGIKILPQDVARIAQRAANSTAIDARNRATALLPQVFDQPEQITAEAFQAHVKRLGNIVTLSQFGGPVAAAAGLSISGSSTSPATVRCAGPTS
jgi:hypothetical protein